MREPIPAEPGRPKREDYEYERNGVANLFMMVESELGMLTTQCLDRRIPDKPTLTTQVAASVVGRNKHHAKANWQFTIADARVKLKMLYPQFE